jgi:hypothetical protein
MVTGCTMDFKLGLTGMVIPNPALQDLKLMGGVHKEYPDFTEVLPLLAH